MTPAGRKLLLVNKRDRSVEISTPDSAHVSTRVVDEITGDMPVHDIKPVNGNIDLGPFEVAVVSWY